MEKKFLPPEYSAIKQSLTRALSHSLSLSLCEREWGMQWVSGEVWEDGDAKEKKISMSCDCGYTERMRAKTPDRKPTFDTKMPVPVFDSSTSLEDQKQYPPDKWDFGHRLVLPLIN
jgi:hypothetical protein